MSSTTFKPSLKLKAVPLTGLIMALAWALALLNTPFVIDFGGDNRLDLVYLGNGFYAPEKRPTDHQNTENSYRWMAKSATLELPWTLTLLPRKLSLVASAPRPARSPDRVGATLTVSYQLDGVTTAIGQFPINGMAEGSVITFNLPAQLAPRTNPLLLKFDADGTFQPGKGDTRNLAAIVYSFKLEPDYATYGFKGWAASLILPLLLGLMSLAIRAWTRFFTRNPLWINGMHVIAGAMLLASLLFWREAAEPGYAPWTFVAWVGCLALYAANKFVVRAPSLPAAFIYAACFLPVLPLAQFSFNRLSLSDLNSDSVIMVSQLAAFGISLVAYTRKGSEKYFAGLFAWAFAIAAILSFIYLHGQVFLNDTYRGPDFRSYYTRQVQAEQGLTPLYDLRDIAKYPGSAVRQPPAYVILFWLPVRLFGQDAYTALLFWRIVNELILIPILLILGKLFGLKRGMLPAILFLVLSFRQLAENVALGQPNYILLLCLSLTALLLKQGREGWAGSVLAYPIWLKLLPVFSGAYFLLEKRWRGLLGLIAGSVVVNVLTGLVIGWDNLWFYFTRALWSVNEPEIGLVNHSFWGFAGRLAVNEVDGSFSGQPFPRELVIFCYLFAALAFGLSLWIIWRAPAKDWLVQQLKFGTLLLMALLIAPFNWKQYAIMSLVVIVALVVMLGRRNAAKWQLAVFAVAYGLLASDQNVQFFPDRAYGLARIASSTFFYALFALWLLCLVLVRRPLRENTEA